MSNLAFMTGAFISCFGLGWALGKWIKSLRQFIDML